ncbi:Histone H1A-related protein [Trichomonas vaginalis G3]|uniref:Histone H1A-related protein n=1 Tax=Trichomonas vaginalis (strain ATCC PRA-98 / G3) TaxID=412133 RepID=A2DJ11_TRIV3|nr:hypothetical protein TVAGG3_0484020 [Trichomonas vaginalis G3]EAY19586.1 Histone H1A-related protein [Trichomonas vaginalis G3]KAI5515916.1 hypothetical protein TVAGG3_0484020 [Trichomonas vaginalis G3]|eukprot:XP_001580572.1 Histone H1A-related protein [Trichomonas vaginalis G3]
MGKKKGSDSEEDFDMLGDLDDDDDFELSDDEPAVKKPKVKGAPSPKKAAPKAAKPAKPKKEKAAPKMPSDEALEDSADEKSFVVDDDDDLDAPPKPKPKKESKPKASSTKTTTAAPAPRVPKPFTGGASLNFGSNTHLQAPRRVGLSKNVQPPPLH